MDTLDKITPASTHSSDTAQPSFDRVDTDDQFDTEGMADDATDAHLDPQESSVEKTGTEKAGMWKFLAAGVLLGAAATVGYAYWRAEQQKPKSKFERFKSRLGLDSLDLTSVPAAVRSVDYDRLNKARRDAGIYAKKAVHKGAKKVAEFTR